MFLSHRVTRPEGFETTIETHAIVHSRFRVHVVRNRRVVAEDGIFLRTFDRKGHVGRPVVTVILAGAARIRAYGTERWIRPGDVSIVESKGAIEMRQEGEEYRSLVVEWDPGLLGSATPSGFEVRHLPDDDLRAIDALASDLMRADADDRSAAEALASVLTRLRSAGLPFDPREPVELIEPVAESALRLSRALDALLSDLAASPMVVDLDAALGVSSRHVTRLVNQFNRRYGYNAESWRDAISRRRITVGVALMSLPEATTEAVSRALGYSSPTAFCRALADAKLPSPGRIAEAIAELRSSCTSS